MTSLKKDVKKYFATECLYELFGVTKDATNQQLKRAYYRVSMRVHPDKVDQEEIKDATTKFQIAGKAYSILSNAEKRKLYDETGAMDDDFSSIKDWSNYFNAQFDFKTLDEFEKQYIGSDEEKEDMKMAYLRNKGDMDKIAEELFFYRVGSDDRVREVIMDLIKKKQIPKYKEFVDEPAAKIAARKKRYEKEAKAAEKYAKKMAVDAKGDADLVALIQQRQRERAGQLDEIAKRFEGENGDDDSDEEDGDFEGLEGDEVDESGDDEDEEDDESGSDTGDDDDEDGDDDEDHSDDDEQDEEEENPGPPRKRTRQN